jgi:hypothetical protein
VKKRTASWKSLTPSEMMMTASWKSLTPSEKRKRALQKK